MKRLGAGNSFGAAAGIGIICILSLILVSTDVLELLQISSESLSLLYNKQTNFLPSSIRIMEDDDALSSSDRITFKLQPVQLGVGPLRNATMGMSYRCPTTGKHSSRTRNLPPPLQGQGILDFATEITSNLRILFIGDSVGQQFSEAMDESRGMLTSWTRFNKTSDAPNTTRRLNLWGCGGYKEILAMSSPLRGGGLDFYWRITDLWDMANKGKPLPASGGGGWNGNLMQRMVDATSPVPPKIENNHTSFDAVILNYISWIKAIDGKITEERYEHSIRLATSVFSPKAIVLVTYGFSRKVDNPEQWKAIYDANQMLRLLVKKRRVALSNSTTSQQQQPAVLLLEFANFTNQLLWHSGRKLGMNVSDPSLVSNELGWEARDNITELLQKLHPWSHTASVCSANVTGEKCVFNSISPDDQHWCMETIGARLTAGLSCLLGCALNNCTSATADISTTNGKSNDGDRQSYLGLCEAECNDRFMTVKPIDTRWMNTSIRACQA